ncbi:MAG: PrsW family intramembrane metalloprotease [Bacteroidetes bacterium]|nr:PrsW family intramembrane metalloprotease [Bacteroidota bacterium]
MLYLSSALAAIIPMMIYLIIIWKFDRYDREPFGLVLQNYLWGAIGAIFFAIIGSSIIASVLSFVIHSQTTLDRTETILVAPFIEELTKGLFLLITFSNKKFDNITDGIVYGGAIGLGFGMTENFLYFVAYGTTLSEWLTIVLIRTLFSGIMHCVSTATFGAFLGYAKFKNIFYKIIFPILGLVIAMFIHFAWNFTVSFESTTMLGFIFMFFTVIIFLIIFSVAILNEKKIIYQELLEEVISGLIPVEHLEILNSSKRNRLGWVDERIRKLYIRAATTLAFRKMELKNSFGSSREFYEKDVEYYRSFIQNLLTQIQIN